MGAPQAGKVTPRPVPVPVMAFLFGVAPLSCSGPRAVDPRGLRRRLRAGPPGGIRAAGSAGRRGDGAPCRPSSRFRLRLRGIRVVGSVRSRLQLTFNTVLVSGARHNGRTFL